MFDDSMGNIGTFSLTGMITLAINAGMLITTLFSTRRAVVASKNSDMDKKVNEKDHDKDMKNMNEKISGLKEYIRDVESRNKDSHDQIREDYVRGLDLVDSKLDMIQKFIESGKHAN